MSDIRTLAIHDVRRDYFDLDLGRYILTFDDGLYSQYYYLPLFRKTDAPLIFFIATGFIRPGNRRGQFDGRYLSHVKSPRIMYEALIRGRLDSFMTLEEVVSLSREKNVRIGAHSHFHDVILTPAAPKKPNAPWKTERLAEYPSDLKTAMAIRSRLAFQGLVMDRGMAVERLRTVWMDDIRHDTECCLRWFSSNLGFVPDIYALPFNEYSEALVSVLSEFGFKTFYGGRPKEDPRVVPRLDIDKLHANAVSPSQ